jgi:hypothetical protein
MGFEPAQCAAAARRFPGNAAAAVAWILSEGPAVGSLGVSRMTLES